MNEKIKKNHIKHNSSVILRELLRNEHIIVIIIVEFHLTKESDLGGFNYSVLHKIT